MSSHEPCPDPEVIAAFVAGALSGMERESTAAHVCSCIDCLAIARMAALVEREPDNVLPTHETRRRTLRYWWVVAAAAVVAAFFANVWIRMPRPMDAMQALVDAGPRGHRNLEARISGGFAWAPLPEAQRGIGPSFDPEMMKLVGAAGSVLERTSDDTSIEGQHVTALAYLLAGQTRQASGLMKKIAPRTADARVWNDLAAASYTQALERGGDPTQFTQALTAAEMALRFDPDLPEALFNRALILDRLGLERQASVAWNRYLEVDPRSEWSREARRRRDELGSAEESTRESQPRSGTRTSAAAGNDRSLQSVLYAAAQGAAAKREWASTLYLLDLALDSPPTVGHEEAAARILLMRAMIEARLGMRARANLHLSGARRLVEHFDVSERSGIESALTAVEATLAPSPAGAIDRLHASLESLDAPEVVLAEMYLQRGRSFAALGKVDDALADFDAGILRIEGVPSGGAWNRGITRKDLFDAATSLAATRGDSWLAFSYAERARTPGEELVGVEAFAKVPEIIIEYKVLSSDLLIFIVKEGHIRVVRSAIRPETLSALVERLTFSATMRDTRQFRTTAAMLYQHLLAPIAEDLEPGRTLVFIPDGPLTGVPFSALAAPAGRYIVEDHPVVVSPSAATYATLAARRHTSESPGLLIVAGPSRNDTLGPLFSVQQEVDAVAKQYVHVARAGYDCSDFASQAPAADVIHFAGHAIVPDDQLPGGLVMLEANGRTGLLDARKIAELPLRHTRLVVLSACSTMRTQGDEFPRSVADAFLVAGVPSVVGTLWSLDDATASTFFPRLHSYLARGASPAEALRAAQLECLHNPALPPEVWATVQLLGS